MSHERSMILVTGASGQLGRLVLAELAKHVPADSIVAAVRSPEKARDLASEGFIVREADYERVGTLESALAGIDRVLLISSNELGKRIEQHRAVVAAALHAKVAFFAYTSLLHADESPLELAIEHRATEADIRACGIPFALLRNGWYFENHTANLADVIAHGAVLGSSGDGRFSSAARADYAAAAAALLLTPPPGAGIYELAGDAGYTKAEFAAAIAQATGRSIAFRNLSNADYEAALAGAGLPKEFAHIIADSDAGAATGALFDDSETLSRLIGRPTQTLHAAIQKARSTE